MSDDTISGLCSDNPNAMSVIENGESERLQLYRCIVQDTARKIASCITNEEFADMFKDLPTFRKRYITVNSFYDILSKYIHANINTTFEMHVTELDLTDKFASLEELMKVNVSRNNACVWRPPHDVSKHLQPYIVQEKIKYKEQLKHMVQEKEDIVNKLKFDVSVARSKHTDIEKHINLAQEKLDFIQNNCSTYTTAILEKFN